MKKIALINQRYGLEVNGGSEYYTRLIAERLSADYEVEVLTSKALSYERWADYYTEDVEKINGVTVRRFGVVKERNDFGMKILSRLIRWFHLNTKTMCDLWVEKQGPYIPNLVEYIRENKNNYDVFIFVTYLYYPTVVGMKEVADKAIFIPTAHDEPYIYFKSHQPLFTLPRAIVYLTEEEKTFVNKLFKNQSIPSVVAGVGVEVPEKINEDRFRDKYNIRDKYFIYVGRVDKSKGCDEMIEYFLRWQEKNREQENTKLVIMGQEFMKIPEHPNLCYLGFVSEEDKFDAIKGAQALWLPSQFESLSISVLEAMTLSVPVLVNGKCEVLKGHCQKSNGGLFYETYAECEKHLNVFSKDMDALKELGQNARDYIEKNYLWSTIMTRIKKLIEGI